MWSSGQASTLTRSTRLTEAYIHKAKAPMQAAASRLMKDDLEANTHTKEEGWICLDHSTLVKESQWPLGYKGGVSAWPGQVLSAPQR